MHFHIFIGDKINKVVSEGIKSPSWGCCYQPGFSAFLLHPYIPINVTQWAFKLHTKEQYFQVQKRNYQATLFDFLYDDVPTETL